MLENDFMRLALEQARYAKLMNEVPVGAVVVYQNEVVGVGANAVIALHDPTAHAEIVALRQAAQRLGNYRLPECDLYVTLEPCAMCAMAMIHARIRTVIYGASDPKTGAAGGIINIFETSFNHQTIVHPNVLADECGQILKDFFKSKRQSAKLSV